jgi:two-component system, NarL family, response regulator DesR
MTRLLSAHAQIELLLSTEAPSDLLECRAGVEADVALLDLALGVNEMNGIDVGLALREQNPDIGIVIFSQYDVSMLGRRVPEEQRMGWAFLPKSGDMSTDDLVTILRNTAQGKVRGDFESHGSKASVLDELNGRCRAVIALASTGLSAPQIAQRLGMSADSVRQDLSRCYRVLVPNAQAGDDIRTRAILAYLELMRDEDWDR